MRSLIIKVRLPPKVTPFTVGIIYLLNKYVFYFIFSHENLAFLVRVIQMIVNFISSKIVFSLQLENFSFYSFKDY